MTWRVKTLPTEEPVSLEEAKEHLRVDMDDDDLIIGAMIASARTHIEQVLERALMPQQWELALDAFPSVQTSFGFCGVSVILPGGNVRALVTVKYLDSTGVEQSFAGENCTLDTHSQPARLGLKQGRSWPSTAEEINAVKIVYDVGYVDADAVPAPIKAAILLLVGELYGNREVSVESRFAEMPTMHNLLWPYRRVNP